MTHRANKSGIAGLSSIRRVGSGYYVIVDRNGVEWDVRRTDDDGTVAPYWLATDGRGGYMDAMTLREIKRDIAHLHPTAS